METAAPMPMSELEARTGLNRRTIHFYVQQGVLPAPEGSGGGARYGEIHLLRLLLTRELQKSHLKLSGVKEALDRMTIEEMRAMAAKMAPERAWDSPSLERWVDDRRPAGFAGGPEAGAEKRAPETHRATGKVPSAQPAQGSAAAPGAAWRRSFLDLARSPRGASGAGGKGPVRQTPSHSAAPGPLPAAPAVQEPTAAAGAGAQTWTRHALAEGLEIHIRADLFHQYGPLLRELTARFTSTIPPTPPTP